MAPSIALPGRAQRSTTSGGSGAVIRRSPTKDASWKPGWGWGGNWTQDAVDQEFDKVRQAWASAQKAISRLRKAVSSLVPTDEAGELNGEADGLGRELKSWERDVTWKERQTAVVQLTDLASRADGARGRAEAEGKGQRANLRQAALREKQQQKQQRIEEAEQRRRRKQQEDDAAEQRRIREEREAQQRIDDAAAAERQRLEDERIARERAEREREERERAEQAERELRGRAAWDAALDRVAASTDPDVAEVIPDRFGEQRRRRELDELLAKESKQLAADGWKIDDVNALAAGDALEQRWARHQLEVANQPRVNAEQLAQRTNQPITRLPIDGNKLWRFFGYPGAVGNDYDMPKFVRNNEEYHFSLTGTSMNDLNQLWKDDPTILMKHPQEIFTALFETGIAPDRRIHVTRERKLQGGNRPHVFLGDVTGAGKAVQDTFFGGDAKDMKAALAELRDELIGKLWQLKYNAWRI